jgi:hypothetical protein
MVFNATFHYISVISWWSVLFPDTYNTTVHFPGLVPPDTYIHDCSLSWLGTPWHIYTWLFTFLAWYPLTHGVSSQESEQSCIYYVSGGTKSGKCGIFCFSIRFWNCSDSVVFFVFFIRFWNCSDSVVFFVFLLDFGIVLIVWYFLFFY